MLSVILLSMLMILLSVLSVIRHLICDCNLNWLLNLNLICETLWTGAKSDLLISMLGKFNWFCLISLITLVLLMWKWMGVFLRKNHVLRCWVWPCLLNWIGALALSLLLKLFPRKLEPKFLLWSFFSPEVALYLYKSTIRPCMEYCCHIWAGAPSCCLKLVGKLQKRICRTVGSSLATSLEPLAHHRNMTSLSLFCKYYFGRRSPELVQLVSLPFSWGRSTRYFDRLHDFSVIIPKWYKDVYVNCFFTQTGRFWISLPKECFRLTYDLELTDTY